MRCVLALTSVALFLGAGTALAAPPAPFTETTAISGLTNPTNIRFSPDGRVFVAEKSGRIKVFDNLFDSTPTTFADLSTKVHDFWDRGLLGIALDPQFPTRPYVYVSYSHDAAIGGTAPRWGDGCPTPPGATDDGCVISGRLSKLTASGDQVTNEQVLIEDWCQQYPSHSIGALAFGPDGGLYMTGGDGASFNFADYGQDGNPLNPCGDPPTGVGGTQTSPTGEGGALRAQDLRTPGDPTNLNGSVIRVNPDTGAALPTNAGAGSSDANARRIVGYGLRNPFRFTFRPGTNELWIGDVGWATWEEIDRLPDPTAPVSNFGWPCREGPNEQGSYAPLNICAGLRNQPGSTVSPYYSYDHNKQVVQPGEPGCPSGGSSISGLAFYNGGSFPAAYKDGLFFADYSRNCIWFMPKGANGLPDPNAVQSFDPFAAGPVDLQVGPGGDLFYADLNGGTIRRIRFPGANGAPTARASADTTAGAAPLTVHFDGTGSSDPDAGDTLLYAWDLDGDGAFDDSTVAKPTWTYPTNGSFAARLRVTDSRNLSDTSAPLTITVGTNAAPAATIATPSAATTWKVGDTINFSGSGSDTEDGALPASALSWALDLKHCSPTDPTNCHTHHIQDFTGVASGSFSTPDHEYPSYLELTLTARDSGGQTAAKTVRLDPKTVNLSFNSAPAGLQLTVGSTTSTTPFARTVIQGSANSLGAPSPQALGPDTWGFSSWSDGGAGTHNIVAPTSSATYTATFTKTTSTPCYAPTVLGTSGLRDYWRMGESSGSSFADSKGVSPAQNFGATLGVPGAIAGDPDKAARFNGLGNYASAPLGLSDTNVVTLEFWLKWNAFANDDRLAFEFTPDANLNPGGFTVDPNESAGGKFEISHRQGAFNSGYNSVWFNRPAAASWHHYALVFNKGAPAASELTAYVDGVNSGAQQASTENFDSFVNSTLYFMSRGGGALFGGGDLDEVAVYGRALTAAEAQNHYARGTTPCTANQQPTASFTVSPNPATTGANVTFNGSGSSDPDGSIAKYEWDLDGNGSYETDTGVTPTTSKSYAAAGNVTVGLRVTDNLGATATTTRTLTVNAAGPSSYAQTVLGTSGLRDYWRMGDASGSSFGDSKGASPAANFGATVGVAGALAGDTDKAARFGGGSYASAPLNLSDTNVVTLEFWSKWNAFANDDKLAFEFTPNYNTNAGGFLVDPNESGGGAFEISERQGPFNTGYNALWFNRPTAAAWHHYALVFNKGAPGATELTAYVDGANAGGTRHATTDNLDSFVNSTLYFMSRGGTSLFGAGDLDEVALYGRALTAAEAQDHYTRGTTGGGGTNQPPSASFTVSPNPATTGQTVTFNGSGSSDPDGSIARYEWDLDGNGSYETDTGVTPTTSKSYATAGSVTVGLRVTDGPGATATTTRTLTVTGAASTYAATILATSGLRDYWRMGETSGASLADSKGTATATAVNGPVLGVPGAIAGDADRAVRFDGTNDFASASLNLSNTNVVTVEFWLKWNAFANNDKLAMEFTPNYNSNAGGFLIDPNESQGGAFEISQRQSGFGYSTARFNRPSAGAWHHYVLVFDRAAPAASELTAHVDGIPVTLTRPTQANTIDAFANSVLYFMSRGGGGLFGAGDLDEVAVYGRALTAAEAADHYTRGSGG